MYKKPNIKFIDSFIEGEFEVKIIFVFNSFILSICSFFAFIIIGIIFIKLVIYEHHLFSFTYRSLMYVRFALAPILLILAQIFKYFLFGECVWWINFI